MKRLSIFALMAGIASAPAFAQQYGRTPMNPPTDQAQQRNEQTQMERRAMDNALPTMTFDQLDTRHAGYLSASDAQRDHWLGMHFKQCDTDGNRQVTRPEYDACTNAVK
ncbi:MAG TPA: EF-hand domain-containing protein [Rhodanobacteraceae bacterium]|nr:EF-hand domain-containing protein [Rhodanobacteraceae bacterium]